MSAVVVKVKNLNFLRCCSGTFFNSWTDWSIWSLDEILPLKRDINVTGFLLPNHSFPSFISKRLTLSKKDRNRWRSILLFQYQLRWKDVPIMLFKSKTVLYITEVIEKTESIKKSQSFFLFNNALLS